jgi:signal transduction histidine kinase
MPENHIRIVAPRPMSQHATALPLPAPELVARVLGLGQAPPADRTRLWADLLVWALGAERVVPSTDADDAHALQPVPGQEASHTLTVPAVAQQLPMVAWRARKWNEADLHWAKQVHALARAVLEGGDAYEAGAAAERERIASDLHDDLGARLLSLAHAASAHGEVAAQAREALGEMRLVVRNLAGHATPLGDAWADWRAESLGRLSAAGVEADWPAEVPGADAATVLPARVTMHLTRVVREAVTNMIRHSGATCCRVRLALEDGALHLSVEDNGCGLPAGGERPVQGMGLVHIERRVRDLNGTHQNLASALGGWKLQLRIPLVSMVVNHIDLQKM